MKKDSDIFPNTIFKIRHLGVWDDNTNGYCPYGRNGSPSKGPIDHYILEFVDKNFTITKEMWMHFFNFDKERKIRKFRGCNHVMSAWAIYEPERDAKIECWQALKDYIHKHALDEHIRLRNEQGLDWETDWYITINTIEAEQYIDSKIREIPNTLKIV